MKKIKHEKRKRDFSYLIIKNSLKIEVKIFLSPRISYSKAYKVSPHFFSIKVFIFYLST